MPYEYLEDVPAADAGFRAWSQSYEGLLRSAWEAVLGLMVEDPESIRAMEERTVSVESSDAELLLYDLLGELLYYKDAEEVLLRIDELSVTARRSLTARLRGERIDRGRHAMGIDVKAITLQGFSVRQTPDGWKARVVVDT